VLVGEEFWRKAFDVDFLVDEGVIDVGALLVRRNRSGHLGGDPALA